LIDEDSVEKLF